MEADTIKFLAEVVASCATCMLFYLCGSKQGMRDAVRDWKPFAESLSNSMQELVDTYGPLLKDYQTLLESYTKAYEILEDNGLLRDEA